ncbi:type II toxin-antitoxin system RelE/ParE family toxin [Gluconobacter oxydans]|uniref:type II toxin-antitoxin system RelE/ParE family toxin n=1 Tax=Gluconobacter oxydans TaxID=442 RepID=UPI00062C8B59|nr:type II toxin-antitoxin system RelE/ParE family toxin [Gluconobacter oxydans]
MTTLPVVLRRRAEQDVEEAVDYYAAEAGEVVALGLVQALQDAYSFIAAWPDTGSLRYAYELALPGLRLHRIKKYPFIVFYLHRADHVDVWRVLHTRRDLPAWMTEPDADERPVE